MNEQQWLNFALAHMHEGQWFGFKEDWTGDHRISYENIIVHDNSITKPTEAEVNAKIEELKNINTEKTNNKTSAQNRLKALGLTDAEIEAL